MSGDSVVDDRDRLLFGAGIFLAGVVGIALYLFAFPENRLQVPIGDALKAEAAASEAASKRDTGTSSDGHTREEREGE